MSAVAAFLSVPHLCTCMLTLALEDQHHPSLMGGCVDVPATMAVCGGMCGAWPHITAPQGEGDDSNIQPYGGTPYVSGCKEQEQPKICGAVTCSCDHSLSSCVTCACHETPVLHSLDFRAPILDPVPLEHCFSPKPELSHDCAVGEVHFGKCQSLGALF